MFLRTKYAKGPPAVDRILPLKNSTQSAGVKYVHEQTHHSIVFGFAQQQQQKFPLLQQWLSVRPNSMFCSTTIGSISSKQWTESGSAMVCAGEKGRKKSRIPCDTCKLKSCLFYQSSMRWRERERQRDCVREMSPPEYNGHTRIIWCVRKCLPMTRAHRTDKRVSFWWEIEKIIELFAFNGNFHRNRLSKWIPY